MKRPRPAASIERIRNSGTTPESLLGAIVLDGDALSDWLAALTPVAESASTANVDDLARAASETPPVPLNFGGLIQHSLYGDPVLRLEWGDQVNIGPAPAAGVLDLTRDDSPNADDADLVRADYATSTDALANALTGMGLSAEVAVEVVVTLPGRLDAAATVFMDGQSIIAALANVPTDATPPGQALAPLFANLRAPPDVALTIAGGGETVAGFLGAIRSDVFALARVLGGAFADARAPIEFLGALRIARVALFMRWRRRA